MDEIGNLYSYEGLTTERTLVVMLHDLRIPAHSIAQFSKRLVKDTGTLTEDENAAYLQTILQHADRINTIINSAALSEQVLKLNK